MEMQRWSTRWKTRRWPWDSAVTVLVTFAILLRAGEVRGGKKAKGSRGVQSCSPPPPPLNLGRRTQGMAGVVFQRKPVRAAPGAGEAKGEGPETRRDGSASVQAFHCGCGFNAVKGMHSLAGEMKEMLVEQSGFSSSSTKLNFVECASDFHLC